MAWIVLLLTLNIQLVYLNSTNDLKKTIQEESEYFEDLKNILDESDLTELMEPQWRAANETNSYDTEIEPLLAIAAALIGAPIVLAALAPPPLPMFPPQGVPQPGQEEAGGGSLPTPGFIVRNSHNVLESNFDIFVLVKLYK